MYEEKKTKAADLKVTTQAVSTEDTIRKQESSYRVSMRATAVRAYPECSSLYTYPLCPRCEKPMEREYQAFCNNCGQALCWKGFSKAVVVISFPNKGRK